MLDRMTHHFERSPDALDRSSDACCTLPGLPDPEEFPTISVPMAARIAGVARRTGYAAAERGEWPTIRVGRSIRVRTHAFLEQYGFLT